VTGHGDIRLTTQPGTGNPYCGTRNAEPGTRVPCCEFHVPYRRGFSLAIWQAAAGSLLAVCALLALAGCESSSAEGHPDVVAVIGRTGRGPGEFLYPRAIDIADDGTLFVVDKTGRVQHLTAEGEFISAFRMPQIEKGKPTGLTVGPDGRLYLADTHYHRVMVYDADGKELLRFGEYGQGDGQFIYPTDVAVRADGRILVSEYGGNDRVSVFSSEGEFLQSFGASGEGDGEFSRPSALALDAERGCLYVADACNHRIARYTPEGKLLGYIGADGAGPGELRYPYDLALFDGGTLVVCEFGNNRIQLFDPQGVPVGLLGRAGREVGALAYPWGVAVSSKRLCYVVDAGNNRLQVWRLPDRLSPLHLAAGERGDSQ